MESHKNKELSRLALLYIETKYPHIMEERFEIANRVANECESTGEIEFIADSIVEAMTQNKQYKMPDYNSNIDKKIKKIKKYIYEKYPDIIGNDLELFWDEFKNREHRETHLESEIDSIMKDLFKKAYSPEIKDSGERYVNSNGGQRDIDEGKFDPAYLPPILIRKYMKNSDYLDIFIDSKKIRTNDYSSYANYKVFLERIIDGVLLINKSISEGLENFAIFLEKASKKYNYNNFQKLTSEEDFYRFRRSLCRHAYKCLMGYTDEFHHEAIIFNAICLLDNFTHDDVIKYVCEPEKYALKGLTDGKKVNNG